MKSPQFDREAEKNKYCLDALKAMRLFELRMNFVRLGRALRVQNDVARMTTAAAPRVLKRALALISIGFLILMVTSTVFSRAGPGAR